MNVQLMISRTLICLSMLLSACTGPSDPAARLAEDIKQATRQLAAQDGSRHTLIHRTPSKPGECAGPFNVQIDQSGLVFVWCKDEATAETRTTHEGKLDSGITAMESFILSKRPAEDLIIELARSQNKILIVSVK